MATEEQQIIIPEIAKPATGEAERLMELALTKKADVEVMERLLVMRDKLKSEQAKEAFDKSMATFQAQCPTIQRTKQGYNYKYAPLEAIVEQVKGLLAESGFSYTFDTDEADGAVIIYCKVKHIQGHMEVSKATITRETTTKMNASQQSGAAMTYGKRYAFINAFGILTGDEDVDATTPKTEKPMTPRQMADQKEESTQVDKSTSIQGDEILKCSDCDEDITDRVAAYSQRQYGRKLCFDCQKEERSKNRGQSNGYVPQMQTEI